MYRQYKYLPEVNRPCCRATRSREYQAHIDALHRIQTHRGTIDTSHPNTPQTIGRNYKRYEYEKQRNLQIRKDNMRLIGKMDKISREEHYPRAPPQRPYTLQGSRQKEEMKRITHENHKLLNAVQDRKPTLNRNDWLMHKLDHQYQLNKMSEYKQTVPMSEIMRQELRMSQGYPAGSSYAGSSTRRSNASTASTTRKSYSKASKGELEDEIDDRTNTLLGNTEHEEDENGPLEDQFEQNADGLLGGDADKNSEKSQNTVSKGEEEKSQDEHEEDQQNSGRQSGASKDTNGVLEDHLEDAANGLFGGVAKESDKENEENEKENNENEDKENEGNENEGNEDENEDKESDKGELEQHVDDAANALLQG